MKFSIEIGGTEKTLIEYEFNQFFGELSIKINGEIAKQCVRRINEPVHEVHEFYFGQRERITVRIEKERKPLIGSCNRVFVNDHLLKIYEGV